MSLPYKAKFTLLRIPPDFWCLSQEHRHQELEENYKQYWWSFLVFVSLPIELSTLFFISSPDVWCFSRAHTIKARSKPLKKFFSVYTASLHSKANSPYTWMFYAYLEHIPRTDLKVHQNHRESNYVASLNSKSLFPPDVCEAYLE